MLALDSTRKYIISNLLECNIDFITYHSQSSELQWFGNRPLFDSTGRSGPFSSPAIYEPTGTKTVYNIFDQLIVS